MTTNTNRQIHPIESAAFRWLMKAPLADPLDITAARAAIAATLRLMRNRQGKHTARDFRAECGRMGKPQPLARLTRNASLNKNAAFMRRFARISAA